MAKKKVSRISPAIPKKSKSMPLYDDLHNGDTFLFEGALFMKCENSEQEAIDMDNGYIEEDMCGKVVEPVNIKIAWTQK